MKIYTRTGDDGTTLSADGQRVPKYHPRIEACGSIDELISWIGLLRGIRENESRIQTLLLVQDILMQVTAILSNHACNEEETDYCLPVQKAILVLENEIDSLQQRLPRSTHFILPGGHIVVSYCHIARCVCRRAERTLSFLGKTEKIPPSAGKFLNRLSDYLFVMARILSIELDNKEVEWRM